MLQKLFRRKPVPQPVDAPAPEPPEPFEWPPIPAPAPVAAPVPVEPPPPPQYARLTQLAPPAPAEASAPRRVVRKYREYRFLVDGQECVVECTYTNQAENERLTDAWAKEQALVLFPGAKAWQLLGARDGTEWLTTPEGDKLGDDKGEPSV